MVIYKVRFKIVPDPLMPTIVRVCCVAGGFAAPSSKSDLMTWTDAHSAYAYCLRAGVLKRKKRVTAGCIASTAATAAFIRENCKLTHSNISGLRSRRRNRSAKQHCRAKQYT